MEARSMEDPIHIDHPDQLTALAQGWQEQRDQQQDNAKISVRLSLLRPLAIPEILAGCRDPSSRYMRDEAGNRLPTRTNHEYLDITALSNLWRRACMQIPPAAIKEVCFDVALPRRSSGEDRQGEVIHWDADMPSEGGIAVKSQECANLIILLATTLKVREGGSGVRYSFCEGEDPRGRMYAVAKMSGTLERLSKYASGASRELCRV